MKGHLHATDFIRPPFSIPTHSAGASSYDDKRYSNFLYAALKQERSRLRDTLLRRNWGIQVTGTTSEDFALTIQGDGLGVSQSLDPDPKINSNEFIELTFSKPVYITSVSFKDWDEGDVAVSVIFNGKFTVKEMLSNNNTGIFGIADKLIATTFSIYSIENNSEFFWSNITFRAANVSAVPLPAALPLYGVGMGLLGLMGWRRKRKQNSA